MEAIAERNFGSSIYLLLLLPSIVAGGWEQVWADEFNGPDIDWNKWNSDDGNGCDQSNCNWGNNEEEWYQKENSFIENGNLVIEARRESAPDNYQYTSSRLVTKNKGDWQFGIIEIRAKLPEGRGIWPAIWMLPTDGKYGGWPRSGEIDIMELVGNEPSTVHMTPHFGYSWNNKSDNSGGEYTLPTGKFSDQFHTFSIEWSEDHIIWMVDGVEHYSITPENTKGFIYPFNERFHLLLNVAVGGDWPKSPDSSTVFPQRMEVDFVRVQQWVD